MRAQPPIPGDLLVYAGLKYADGWSIRRIAAEIRYSYGATRNGLLRAGVKLRSRGARRLVPANIPADLAADIERAITDPSARLRRGRPARRSL